MDMWFGLEDVTTTTTCARRQLVRSSRLSSSLLQEDILASTGVRRRAARRIDLDTDFADSPSRHCRSDFSNRVRNIFENSAVKGSEISEVEELRTKLGESSKRIRGLEEENFKLRAVITELTEVNKRWQQYHHETQLYIRQLLSNIHDLEELRDKFFLSSAHKSIYGDEIIRLRTEVAAVRAEMKKREKEYKEHLELLELQLKAHRDDWEAERSEKHRAQSDKEAAVSRVHGLEKELRNLKIKLQEEKTLRAGLCTHCCGTHICERETRHYQPVEASKTYTTSVHLPCSSGQLLSRGTTLYFGDDVVIDGENHEEKKNSRSASLGDLKQLSLSEKCTDDENLDTETKEINVVQTKNISTDKVIGNAIEFNIAPENVESKVTNFVVHQSSCCGNSGTLDSDVKQSTTGVTIGFNSSGLASVTSFSPHMIVKSSSAPVSSENEHSCKTWFVRGPPTEIGLVTTKSEGSMPASSSIHKISVPWKSNNFESGIETQTREDVMCPGCSKVFPPELHLQFLDHFEKCQKKSKKCSSETVMNIKSRN